MWPVTTRALLEELAQRHGVATSYTSQSGFPVHVADDTIAYTLRALGVAIDDNPDDAALTQLLYDDYLDRSSQPLPHCVVAPQGQERGFVVHVHAGDAANVHIELEEGGTREVYQDPNDAPDANVDGTLWGEASFHIPGDLPMGYHELVLESGGIGKHACPLIITPARLSTADEFVERPISGVMAQLYSVRSESSWGIGDFQDLGQLAETLAPHADFLLVNPLHAAEPLPPVEDSPYLPTTRRFINPLYLHIESIPELKLLPEDLQDDVRELAEEFRQRNRSAEEIDRDTIFEAKLQVLRELFNYQPSPEREEAFVRYAREEGRGLRDFAYWCAQQDAAAQSGQRHAEGLDMDKLTRFYSWLQFLCDEQLAAAQQRALDAGMRLGLVTDLAVGVHPGGADAVNLTEYLAPQCSVGAPPDDYNQQGQDWSQPPWHPQRLAAAGYAPWREMLSTVLRHAGGVRVDHILGLFRLYWIPRMASPLTGTYVSYDFEAMVGILALEAQRAGAVVIGEDLGTVEPWVQDVLAQKAVLGTSIVWFERDDDDYSPLPQDKYRQLALSSVNTHDLPPTLAYLRGDHISLRARLGVLTCSVEDEQRDDIEWQARVLGAVADRGLLPQRDYLVDPAERASRGAEEDISVALHRYIAGTPSALACTSLVDMVGDVRAQNQPGTTHELYPNWCVPLCDTNGTALLIEDLAGLEFFQRLAATSRKD